MNDFPLPIIGFCAYSGIGKTTLLTKLISLLTTEGIRVGVVKHAHHDFDIDHPGKDSYELRHAGASQMLVASRRRTALIVEHTNPLREPKLADVLTNLRLEDLDLVLVEGFKQEAIPKIELHRSGMNRPLLFPSDPNVVAIACDYEIDPGDRPVTTLDINNIQQISHFIRQYMPNRRVAAIR
jgi:molybdopterin-guanine dinucleotide biosynthesis protein MobB